jgi:hypothetical protein
MRLKRNMMHRRKKTDASQTQFVECASGAVGGVGRRWIEHEETDEPGWVARDGLGDRRFVPWNTRHEDRTIDTMAVELRDPPVRKCVDCDRIVPLQLAADLRR